MSKYIVLVKNLNTREYCAAFVLNN